ncbi:cytochrome c maturation protein CcmE [Rappaport israeli]|uniref:cytochrome c maturation protein CcmE n=1 Tax=Rappaport israeli TaxID=1839807 RepID=UPI000930D385|nr:cytochrome c maturation protein CcmE [Rappaport israeli]
MKPAKKKRLALITLIFSGFSIAVGLLLFAMQQDLNHYYSLESYAKAQIPTEQAGIRVGGMVQTNSLKRQDKTLNVEFAITDFQNPALTIRYTGILPDLFREGQGVIAKGKLSADGIFYADSILAKHDENYMPPEVAADMQRSGYNHQTNRYSPTQDSQ